MTPLQLPRGGGIEDSTAGYLVIKKGATAFKQKGFQAYDLLTSLLTINPHAPLERSEVTFSLPLYGERMSEGQERGRGL